MLYVIITGSPIGRTHFYEKIGRRGRRTLVPTYRAELGCFDGTGAQFHFAVTRDAAQVVFGQRKKRFLRGGECPPSKTCAPYRGRIHVGRRNGFALLLFDEHSPTKSTLVGQGSVVRSEIMLHSGPSSSLGCMAIAGGRRGYRAWQRALKKFTATNRGEILVFVEPRPQADHDRHLSRHVG